MDSREEYPRVSLDTLKDWQRFKANYKTSSVARLEELIVANGHADHRDALMAHMSQYLDETFLMAQPNLRINGHNFESLEDGGQNMEPFDESLDRRIWSLADTRLQWHKRIAETRKQVPTELEAALKELFEQQDTDISTNFAGTKDIEADLTSVVEEFEGIQETCALVEELNQTIPEQVERSQRVAISTAQLKALK